MGQGKGGRMSQRDRTELLKRQNYMIEMQQKKDFQILTFKLDLVREIVLKVVDKSRNPMKRIEPQAIAEYAVKVVNETFDALTEDPEEEAKPEAVPAPTPEEEPEEEDPDVEEDERREVEEEEVEIMDLDEEPDPAA